MHAEGLDPHMPAARSTEGSRGARLVALALWTAVAVLVTGFLEGLSRTTPLSVELARSMALCVHSVYRVLGLTSSLSGFTVTVNGFSMSIAPVTLAGSTLALASLPILLYPARWHRKLAAWLATAAILCGMNFFRLVLLGILGFWSWRLFEIVHLYLFQILFIAAVLACWGLAVLLMDGRPALDASLRDAPLAPARSLSPPGRAAVLVLGVLWAVLLAGLVLAILLTFLAVPALHASFTYASGAIGAAELLLCWWILGALALRTAGTPAGGGHSLLACLRESALRLPDLLRAALYAKGRVALGLTRIWPGIQRLAVVPGTLVAAARAPGLSGREAYERGQALAEDHASELISLLVSAGGVTLILTLAGMAVHAEIGVLLGACASLPIGTLLWAEALKRASLARTPAPPQSQASGR